MVVIFLAWCLPTIAALQFYESVLGHKRLVDPFRKLFYGHKLKETSRTHNPIPFAMFWGHIFFDAEFDYQNSFEFGLATSKECLVIQLVVGDSAQMLVGRSIGCHFVCPTLSPKKTFEGTGFGCQL